MSRAEKMTDSSLQKVENGAAPNNGESATIAAISSMSELLVSSITSMKSTMAESLGQMKDSIDQRPGPPYTKKDEGRRPNK